MDWAFFLGADISKRESGGSCVCIVMDVVRSRAGAWNSLTT